MDSHAIKAAVMASFIGELEAFKPGNVGYHADGHGMTVSDFQKSAVASLPFLCQQKNGVGQRILDSIRATWKAVGYNTNLGMLLLFAPIIKAAESEFNSVDALRHNLERTLNSLTKTDAEQVFAAIRLAKPGGLGRVAAQDVNKNPDCALHVAMALAKQRDSIALQYTNNFQEIFDLGLATIKNFEKRWNSVKWSTVACYLSYMASMSDSHIERKFGRQIATQIKIKSTVIAEDFRNFDNPEKSIALLQDFDKDLKTKKYNPGTSADLTAASLLVYNLT